MAFDIPAAAAISLADAFLYPFIPKDFRAASITAFCFSTGKFKNLSKHITSFELSTESVNDDYNAVNRFGQYASENNFLINDRGK